MARESAAQKKAREAEEAKQADQAGGDGAPAAPDLLKFVNPEAAQAEAEAQAEVVAADQAAAAADAQPVADGKDDEGDTPVAPDEADEPAKPVTAEPETTVAADTGNDDREYEVIVDSIGLGPAQVATRGETLRLNASRAQRLLSLKAVRPA